MAVPSHPMTHLVVDLITRTPPADLQHTLAVCLDADGEVMGATSPQRVLNAMFFGYEILDMYVEEAGGDEPIHMAGVALVISQRI